MAQEKKVAAKPADGKAEKSAKRMAAKFKPVVRKYYPLSWTDTNGVKHIEKKLCWTVKTLKDGTRIAKEKRNKFTLANDGSVIAQLPLYIALGRNGENGEWTVSLSSDDDFLRSLFDLVSDMSEDIDLTGTMGDIDEFLMGCAESDTMTDEQAAKVREFLTPAWVDAKSDEQE